MRYFLSGVALLALTACDPTVPDSGAGVGFQDYSEYQRQQAQRDAQLTGTTVPAAAPVAQQTLPSSGAQTSNDPAEQLAADAAAALNSGQQPVDASPSNPAPTQVDNPGISDENDFDAVGQRRSIESDAERIAQNRSQYKVIEPTALPSRSGGTGPNIVDYALNTSNPVGAQVYTRKFASQNKADRNCAKFASPDLAQAEFLTKGGPKKDRLGIDPDGDGYACSWDPTPFRNARGG